jgi:hypothetical protein
MPARSWDRVKLAGCPLAVVVASHADVDRGGIDNALRDHALQRLLGLLSTATPPDGNDSDQNRSEDDADDDTHDGR